MPFLPEEFVARVVAIMRRSYRDALVFTPVLRLGDLEIDILNRRVCVGASELHLTSLEQSQNDQGVRRAIHGGYVMRRDGAIGFRVGKYDRRLSWHFAVSGSRQR